MRIKKISIALLSMILSYSCMPAQSNIISIGPRVGINLADVTNVDESKVLTGIAAGVTTTYSISESFGITLDVLYSQEGYKIEGTDIESNLDYIQIPIFFNVFFSDLGDAFRPKVYAGVSPGILIGAEYNDTDISDSMNGAVISLAGGLGFNYRLAESTWLNIDLRSFLGLNDIRDSNSREGDKVTSRNIQISAGVAFGL